MLVIAFAYRVCDVYAAMAMYKELLFERLKISIEAANLQAIYLQMFERLKITIEADNLQASYLRMFEPQLFVITQHGVSGI